MLACPCLSGSQNISVSVSRGAGWLPGYPRPWKHTGHAELVTGSNFPCFWWFVVGDVQLSQKEATFALNLRSVPSSVPSASCVESVSSVLPTWLWGAVCLATLPFPGQQGGCRCAAIALGSGLVGARPQESRATLRIRDSVSCVDLCVLCPWRRPPVAPSLTLPFSVGGGVPHPQTAPRSSSL